MDSLTRREIAEVLEEELGDCARGFMDDELGHHELPAELKVYEHDVERVIVALERRGFQIVRAR